MGGGGEWPKMKASFLQTFIENQNNRERERERERERKKIIASPTEKVYIKL